ncbi:unnamed protein product [Ilex paraguariensis]|uniref:Uncharacterized protein n=1 Tax=Ilex paraguariensis TaxID=185542 RepID=A0ABC8SBY6_9AQUA
MEPLVFMCGDNSSFCCGHGDTGRPIFKPRLVEALKGVSCKRHLHALTGDDRCIPGAKVTVVHWVCASKRKTFVLVDDGSVYGFGWMGFGSLGFASDKVMRPRVLDSLRPHHISQVSTGLYHTVVVTNWDKFLVSETMKEHNLGMKH